MNIRESVINSSRLFEHDVAFVIKKLIVCNHTLETSIAFFLLAVASVQQTTL